MRTPRHQQIIPTQDRRVNERRFHCQYCSHTFHTKNLLMYHISMHHTGPFEDCEYREELEALDEGEMLQNDEQGSYIE